MLRSFSLGRAERSVFSTLLDPFRSDRSSLLFVQTSIVTSLSDTILYIDVRMGIFKHVLACVYDVSSVRLDSRNHIFT